jgi:catechol 2,3-dioxygenase-like lactoylglutathione lyase family enzyme
MELTISRLLGEFEKGTLSRRQLVQALAMILVAPAAAARPELAPSEPHLPAAEWKTVWLDHISFQVADYKRSAAFYSSLMGWRVTQDTGSEAVLDINGRGGIIIRNYPKGEGPPSTNVTAVVDHISWGVEPWDTDAVKRELDKRKLNPEADMDTMGFRSFHVKDPDGWDLQISNQTKEKHNLRV